MKFVLLILFCVVAYPTCAQVTGLVRSLRLMKKVFPDDAVLFPLEDGLVLFKYDPNTQYLMPDIDLNTLVYGAGDLYSVMDTYEMMYNRNIYLFSDVTDRERGLLKDSMNHMRDAISQLGIEYEYARIVYNRIVKNYQRLLNITSMNRETHPAKTNFTLNFDVFDEDIIVTNTTGLLMKRDTSGDLPTILGLGLLNPGDLAAFLMEKYGNKFPLLKNKVIKDKDQIKSFSALHSVAMSVTLASVKTFEANDAVSLNEELSEIIRDHLHEDSKTLIGPKASNAILSLWKDVCDNFSAPLERTEIQNVISEEAVVTGIIERTVYASQSKYNRIPRLKPIDRNTIKHDGARSLVDIANRIIKQYNYVADHDGDPMNAYLDSYLTAKGVIPGEGKEDEFRFTSKYTWKVLKYIRPYTKNTETFKVEEVERVVDTLSGTGAGRKSVIYSASRPMSPQCQQDDNIDRLSNLLNRSGFDVQTQKGESNTSFVKNNQNIIKKALQGNKELKDGVSEHLNNIRFIVSRQISKEGKLDDDNAELYELTLGIQPLDETNANLGYNLKVRDALKRGRYWRNSRARAPVRVGR